MMLTAWMPKLILPAFFLRVYLHWSLWACGTSVLADWAGMLDEEFDVGLAWKVKPLKSHEIRVEGLL